MILVSIFLSIFFLISSFSSRSSEEERLVQKIRGLSFDLEKNKNIIRLEKRDRMSDVPFYDLILKKIKPVQRLKVFVRQSGSSISPGIVILVVPLLGLTTFLIGLSIHLPSVVSFCLTAGVMGIPFGIFGFKRSRRFKRFTEAFPDAVSRMASSLRAGFSLQMAFETVAEDTANIVGQEFKIVVTELEIGQSFEEALKRILERIDTPEIRLFISSVILQSGSGGNLAELLDNLEKTIRERFELKRELEAASAQAKLSGLVLSFLPVFVGFFVFMIHRDYILFFIKDPAGKILLGLSAVGQVLGISIIQRIVHIEY